MKKIISVSSIAILSSLTLLGFNSIAQAQGAVSCATDGTTAVCTDEAGNVGAATVHDDGSTTAVGVGADGSTTVQTTP